MLQLRLESMLVSSCGCNKGMLDVVAVLSVTLAAESKLDALTN